MTSENKPIGESIETSEDDKVVAVVTQPDNSSNGTLVVPASPTTDDQDSSNPTKLDTNQINFDHAECLPLLVDRHDLHFNHFPGTYFICHTIMNVVAKFIFISIAPHNLQS